jgi:hypothetical protein
MQAFRFLNLAILSALLTSSAALYAQDEKQEEKPPRQEEPRPQAQQDEAKPPRQDEARPPKQDEVKPTKQEKQEQEQEQKQSNDQVKQERQAHPEQQADRGRAAGKSAHIPDDKFRGHFGRGHTFNVKQTVIVEGQPRFQYGGYYFALVDGWPVGWAYTDDCYIDYIDGEYFLLDLLHPGVRVAVFVVM